MDIKRDNGLNDQYLVAFGLEGSIVPKSLRLFLKLLEILLGIMALTTYPQ